MLSVSDLKKSFFAPSGEPINVLRGVSFAVNNGETLAITGASGAGKSTLLHLLGGLEPADSGTIRFGSESILAAPASTRAGLRNRHIGYIFQFHHLLPDLTATENVALPLLISRIDFPEATRRARKALEEIGLSERADHPISYLSGGEQQRVAVSRALINQPDLVLADEPTGNLDSAIEEEIARQLVTYAKKEGRALIVATHNEKLAGMCDRVLGLREGRLHDFGLSEV